MREQRVMRYESMSVQELALEAKSGDREARNTLFLTLQSRIAESFHSARQLLGNLGDLGGPLEQADIEQQAFLTFCKVLDNWLPQRKPFEAYMDAVLHWYAVDYIKDSLHLRSKRTRIVRNKEGNAASEDTPLATSDPADIVEGSEQWEALLAQLSADWRRFVSMKFYEGLSSREIAEVSHRSPRTVNRTLRAALELLRHNTQEEWEAL